MKNENRGGARPGAGRKPISAGGEKVDKKIRATITIRPSDHARIKAAAELSGISTSEFLTQAANDRIFTMLSCDAWRYKNIPACLDDFARR